MAEDYNFFKSNDGTRICYKYIRGRKPCLVFLHGLTGSYSAWNEIYPAFEKKGYSVLLVDLRGHGYSDKPEEKEKYSINLIRDDLHSLLDHLKIRKVILISHCYGGLVSQAYYSAYPEDVSHMILISTSYGFSSTLSTVLIYYFYSMLSLLLYPLHFENNKVHLDYRVFKDTFDFSLRRLSNDIRAVSFRTFLPLEKELLAIDYKDKLADIRIPVLILHGKKDLFISIKTASEMNRLIPGSRLELIDTNHISILSKPDEIAGHISAFLEQKAKK